MLGYFCDTILLQQFHYERNYETEYGFGRLFVVGVIIKCKWS